MADTHFSQRELARRLRISPRTLEGWRWRGTGPRFVKAGGRVLYRLEDVEAFEETQLRQSTHRRSKSRSSTICTKAEGDA